MAAGSCAGLSRVAEADAVEEGLHDAQGMAAVGTRRLGDPRCRGPEGGFDRARRCRLGIAGCGVLGRDERSHLIERDGAVRAREATVAHVLETRWEHMLEQAPQELERIEFHGAPAPRDRLLPAQAHAAALEGEDARVGDRDAGKGAGEVAGEVAERLRRVGSPSPTARESVMKVSRQTAGSIS